jgi:hypothetical protein
MPSRASLAAAALCLLGAAAGYLLYEWHVRRQIAAYHDESRTPLMVLNQPLHYSPEIDGRFGRKAEPGIGGMKTGETFTTAWILGGEVVLQARVRTNNLGFLSDKPYRLARDPRQPEFRIWFAGDSLTGTTTMNRQWVDLVEDLLNANPEARRAASGRAFRTINGGVPGAGFRFFWEHYDAVGRRFDPDLVIVNYVENDLPRVGKAGHEARTLDERYMVEHAAGYVKRFVAEKVPVVFTLNPQYHELYPRPYDWRLSRRLREAAPGMDLVFMHERLPWREGEPVARAWYNLPHDAHMSDAGGVVYARAIARLVLERASGKPAPADASEGFDAAAPPAATAPRRDVVPVGERDLPVAAFVRLRRDLDRAFLEPRSRSWRPYGLYRLLRREARHGVLPAGVPYTAGFVPLVLPLDPPEEVLLNVFCTKGEVSLANPDCYHAYQVYAR